jgi:pimeloyl-ACP methyl ester carboxylesterase
MDRVPTSLGELAYLDEGTGEVVLLLHGWPVDVTLWRRMVPLLAARFRVVAPDLVLGGDLRDQAAAVRELLAALDVERLAVIGHSHGGGVAQLLALDGPGVDAMVLLDSVAFDVTPPDDLEPRAFLERGSVEFATLPDDDLAAYLATPFRFAPDLAGALLGREPELEALDLPAFLLWGEEDPFVPVSVAERLNAAIPASTLGVVPESGHFLLDDAFESVGVLIAEWLRARYLGAPHGHEGLVMLQLERRPPWVDLAPYEQVDEEVATPDPAEQEVGPNA